MMAAPFDGVLLHDILPPLVSSNMRDDDDDGGGVGVDGGRGVNSAHVDDDRVEMTTNKIMAREAHSARRSTGYDNFDERILVFINYFVWSLYLSTMLLSTHQSTGSRASSCASTAQQHHHHRTLSRACVKRKIIFFLSDDRRKK
jgi:hypothetical protein